MPDSRRSERVVRRSGARRPRSAAARWSRATLGVSGPDQETGVAEILHCTDRYWNDLPAVVRYLQQRSTGDRELWWMEYLRRRYDTPFRRGLILACGTGWVERELMDRGIVEHFDA